MITRSKIKKIALALSGAVLAGTLAAAAPAEAGHRAGWGAHRHVIVHRPVAYRPVVRRVVTVHRPAVYRRVAYRPVVTVHRPVVYRPADRRVVVVERGFHPGHGHGWRRRVGHHPGWHDRPRCWLPERHLCR